MSALLALLRQIADYGARGTTMPEVCADPMLSDAVRRGFVDIEPSWVPSLQGYERVRLTSLGWDELRLADALEGKQ